MSLHALATHMAQTGRGPDSMLVHMSPREVQSLQALAKANGGELTINPQTGLPEAGFLEKLLPAIAGAAAIYFTGGAAAPEIIAGMSNPATLGLGAAALGKASGKSVAESIQLGMGVYGGAGLAGLASTAGTGAIAAGAAPAPIPTPVPTPDPALAGSLPNGAAHSAIDIGGFNPAEGMPTAVPNAVTADATLNIRPELGSAESLENEAQTISRPPAASAPVVASAPPPPPPGSLVGPDSSAAITADEAAVRGVQNAYANTTTGETMTRGLKEIASSPGKYMNMGTAKMGLAALAPAMMGGSKLANKPAEGNIREFDFDPITGKYRKLRTTPASQYNAEGMASGGVTSLLSFADGGSAMSNEQFDSINAYLATNPTEEELAAAMAKYGVLPADLAAAKEYGSSKETASGANSDVANKNTPARQKPNEYSRAYTPEELTNIRATYVQYQNDPAALMKLMDQYGVTVQDLALARDGRADPDNLRGWNAYFTNIGGAKDGWGGMYTATDMNADDKAYMDWMLGQPNPYGQGTLGDMYKAKGTDPYNSSVIIAQAKAENARAQSRADFYKQNGQTPPPTYTRSGDPNDSTLAAWLNPNWKTDQAAYYRRLADRDAAQTAASPGVVVGPFGSRPTTGGPTTGGPTTGGPTTGGPTTSGPRVGTVTGTATPTSKAAMQGFYDQYFTAGVPIGYSQPWGGGTIVKQSADTAYYTEKNGTKHVLQKGMDVDSVYALSPYIAEQWGNEFLYTIDPTKAPPIAGPATTATLTPFSAPTSLKTSYNYSPQGIMTSQGVLAGSEKGGTTGANVSQMRDAYQEYWQNAPAGSTIDFAGGKLTRTGGAQAVYTGADGKTYSLSPTSDLNIIAAQSPAIAETWRNEFGMVPQNYMTGESARNYEFLRGNAPYSVNQQNPGIARPYGEMALGLPGATFGNDAIINQRDISKANAAIAKETAGGGRATTVAPAIQRGYGVTDAGTYNMQTVYDPNTQRYVENNLYTTPEQTAADATAAAAIPSPGARAGGLMALGGMTGISSLGDYSDGGRLLRGPGDGVSDSIPATIGNKQQARLADGEFVVPARIVSELGNGSTEAGARQLYAMMDRIQKNRSKTIGKNNVAVNSKAAKQLPA